MIIVNKAQGVFNMKNDLINNLDKLHTTVLGEGRISKNLKLDAADTVGWCRQMIEKSKKIIRKGKNWYVYIDESVLTINAHSFTIITAHKI